MRVRSVLGEEKNGYALENLSLLYLTASLGCLYFRTPLSTTLNDTLAHGAVTEREV